MPFEQEKLTEYTEIGVDDAENREFLCKLLEAMYDELPAPKKKKLGQSRLMRIQIG